MLHVQWGLSGLLAVALLATAPAPIEASRPARDEVRAAATVDSPAGMRRGMPSDGEVIRLVRETLALFVASVSARDLTALRAEAAASVQRQLSIAEINETFKPFFDAGLDSAAVGGLEPVLTFIRAHGTDAIVLEGYVEAAPQALAFRLSFVREGLAWRWSHVHFAMLPRR